MIINFANLGGGGGGTTNYNSLQNKPQINSITLSGNTSLDTLDIPSKSDIVSGELMVGLTKNIYSPTGTITEGTFTERTTAGNVSVSTGVAQLRKIAANSVNKQPTYEGFVANVTDGHLTASSTGTTYANYSGYTYEYGATGWSPTLEASISTTGTPIVGDKIVTSKDANSAWKLTNKQFSDSTIEVSMGNPSPTYANNTAITCTAIEYYGDIMFAVSIGYTWNASALENYLGITFNKYTFVVGDTFTFTKVYPITCTVTEAPRANHLTVAVDSEVFQEEHPQSGTYEFTYSNSAWSPSLGEAITLTGTPLDFDKITVFSVSKDYGEISSATPTVFWATSMNLFNKNDSNAYEVGKAIDASGNVISQEGSYLVKFKSIPAEYGYVAYSEVSGITKIGIAAYATATTVDLSGATQDSQVSICVPTTASPYVYVATTDIAHLCIHPQWSGYENKTYVDYSLDTLSIPTVDVSGATLPQFIAVGNTRNEYDFAEKTYTQRVESIAATEELIQQYRLTKVWGTDYIFDDNHIYQVLQTPIVYNLADTDYTYQASDFGWEGFSGTSVPVVASSIYYMENLVDKLRRDVVTKEELNAIKLNKIEAVSALPTTNVSENTAYNYDGKLYKYVTSSGNCGQWFGYTDTSGSYTKGNLSYAYHLLDNLPNNYHLATFRYFTSKYAFIVIDKTNQQLNVYSATTNSLESATLVTSTLRNGNEINLNNVIQQNCAIKWVDYTIYFRDKSDYCLSTALNNPTVESAHYELVGGLNAGELWYGNNYGMPEWDKYGNICRKDNVSSPVTYVNGSGIMIYMKTGQLPNFFAPTAAGSNGQILKSGGSGAPSWVDAASVIGGVTFWTGTQDQYDALGTYSNSVVYLIKEDE